MKTITKFVALAFLALAPLFLTGCGNSPSHVAVKFMEALIDCNRQEAKQYGSIKTNQFLDAAGDNLLNGFRQAKRENVKITCRAISEQIEGNTALVKLEVTRAGKVVDQPNVNLTKIDGDWKVEFHK